LILAINLFTLLGAYYLLKTVRESLILAEGGAEVKTYSCSGWIVGNQETTPPTDDPN
jgi:ATP:ADP antiporter, AAA family